MAKRSVQRVYPLENRPVSPLFFSLSLSLSPLWYLSPLYIPLLRFLLVITRLDRREPLQTSFPSLQYSRIHLYIYIHTKSACESRSFKSCSVTFERITFSQDPPHSFIATKRNRFEAISRVLISRWLPWERFYRDLPACIVFANETCEWNDSTNEIFFFSRRGKERASIYDSRVVGSMQSNFVCVELMVYVSFFDLSISFNLTCKRMTKIKEVSFVSSPNLAEKICRNIICNRTIFLSVVSRCAVKFYYRQWGIIECAHDTVTFGWFRGNICSLEYRCESRFEWF